MLTPQGSFLASHEEFQRLVQEHSHYSQRLESLTQKRYLTDDEKLEEVRLPNRSCASKIKCNTWSAKPRASLHRHSDSALDPSLTPREL